MLRGRVSWTPGQSQAEEDETKHDGKDDVPIKTPIWDQEVKDCFLHTPVVLLCCPRIHQGIIEQGSSDKEGSEAAGREPHQIPNTTCLQQDHGQLVPQDSGQDMGQGWDGQHIADEGRVRGDPEHGGPGQVSLRDPHLEGDEGGGEEEEDEREAACAPDVGEGREVPPATQHPETDGPADPEGLEE